MADWPTSLLFFWVLFWVGMPAWTLLGLSFFTWRAAKKYREEAGG